MAKQKNSVDISLDELARSQTFNPLLAALRENDKDNLFKTNAVTAFHKTGYVLFDYYFGTVANIHNELGQLTSQERRVGQSHGTFNLIIGNSGCGKGLAASTKLPSPDKRYILMKDLKIGDRLFDENGEPTTVIGVYPQGEMDIYKITFDDDRTSYCDINHLWKVYYEEDNILKNKIISMKDLLKDYSKYKIKCLNTPVKYESVDIGIWPYGLGKMLAVDNCSIPDTYACNHPEIRKEVLLGLLSAKDYAPLTGHLYDEALDLTYSLGINNNEYITFKNIKLDHREESICIKVDNKDEMFLTEHFIPTHNTTLAAQIAANIIRQYPYSNVLHFDCENRFDASRCESITNLTPDYFEQGRYIIKNGMVGLDVIQKTIAKIWYQKMNMKDQLSTIMPYKDEFNKEIKILQPTVVIIDSITTVLSETYDADSVKQLNEAGEMRGNTEGARDARTLKGLFKDVLPMCKEANIILYGINHINVNMSMNAFIPVARQQNFMKQDEVIPGGKTMLYYPHNIIKLTAKPSDNFTVDADGFNGHIVMVEPVKSSSNQSGNNSKGISFNLVFSYQNGFDNLRSLILYGKDNGMIDGNRNRMKFRDDDSFTFNWKELNTEVNEKPIWESVQKFIIPTLDKHLPFIDLDHNKFDMRSLDY